MNYCTWLLDPAQNFPVFQRCPLLWLTPPQSAENKLTAYFLNNYNIMGDKLFLNVLAPNFNINLKFNMTVKLQNCHGNVPYVAVPIWFQRFKML